MKILFFLLVLAAAGLFFHDKQQTADLAKAQDENAQLTQQLATSQASVAELQAKIRQLMAQVPAQAAPAFSTYHPLQPQRGPTTTQGANPLDQPAHH